MCILNVCMPPTLREQGWRVGSRDERAIAVLQKEKQGVFLHIRKVNEAEQVHLQLHVREDVERPNLVTIINTFIALYSL